MQMQENVGEHAEGAIAWRVVVLMAENRSVNQGLGRLLQNFDLFFGFSRKIRFEGFEVFLDASLQTFDQSSGLAIFSVRRFLFGHRLLPRSVAARTVSFSLLRVARLPPAPPYTGKDEPGSPHRLWCPLGRTSPLGGATLH